MRATTRRPWVARVSLLGILGGVASFAGCGSSGSPPPGGARASGTSDAGSTAPSPPGEGPDSRGNPSGGKGSGGGSPGEGGDAGSAGGAADAGSTGGAADAGSTGGGTGLGVTAGNPFTGARMYVNPDYAAEVQTSIAADPADAALLQKMQGMSTAIWLDRIAKVSTMGRYLDDALALQRKSGKPVVTAFVVYDLPARDCAAQASNGELGVGDLTRYQREFIDPIAAQIKAHPDQRIVAIIEPDSLPNLATNLNQPRCQAAKAVYLQAVAYAISTLAMPNAYLYLDAAHAGWIGWTSNQTALASVFAQVLAMAGGNGKIRGFATNVSNYTVPVAVPELFDYQGNPCHDETIYEQQFGQALAAAGITGKSFIMDTSRNGLGGIRRAWGSWCNVQGAGIGHPPAADPAPGVDAYYWVKPPGESDGTGDPASARFDPNCANGDATPNAPEAGGWFHSYFVGLVHRASPAL